MTSKALEYSKDPKMSIKLDAELNDKDDLSLAYTPGIAEVSKALVEDPDSIYDYTFRRNNLAVISDGSAVLGLGNIGHLGSYPVMEGKAMLFKKFAGIDAIPIVIRTQDVDEFVQTVEQIADSFAAINLEDISAPRCFEIEDRLKSTLEIPLMHDDQHGTAVVALAGLINALKLTGRSKDLQIVVLGTGAAGVAITKMLLNYGFTNIVMVDSQGILCPSRELAGIKKEMREKTNPEGLSGDMSVALKGADVFMGVSKGGILSEKMIKSMNSDPIIIAMANPTPEIMPDVALSAGASIVATGRSDFPNQVNNALAFPGIFRSAIDNRSKITEEMKLAAAEAIVKYHEDDLSKENLLPSILDPEVHKFIAREVSHVIFHKR